MDHHFTALYLIFRLLVVATCRLAGDWAGRLKKVTCLVNMSEHKSPGDRPPGEEIPSTDQR